MNLHLEICHGSSEYFRRKQAHWKTLPKIKEGLTIDFFIELILLVEQISPLAVIF